MLYVDRSGEISQSLKTLSIMPQGSRTGVPLTNAVAERANGDVLVCTRTLLLAVGLPHYVWEYAMRCYCVLDNVNRVDGEGVSPWRQTRGADFKREVVTLWLQCVLQGNAM